MDIRRKNALLQVAATLLPTYINEVSTRVRTEGADMYIRSEPRRLAIQEALALEAELEKQEEARIKALTR